MNPAYHIPLSDEELKLLGEISAIQGQIEFFLQDSLIFALGVGRPVTMAILGESGLGKSVKIWIAILREKARTDPIRDLANEVHADLMMLTKGRNSLLHAVFATDLFGGFGFTTMPTDSSHPTIAVRTSNMNTAPASEIKKTRDFAAKIS